MVGVSPFNTTFQVCFAFLTDETESSYTWALNCLSNLYPPGQNPSVLVTDKEKGLVKAVERRFPTSNHLLCRFHIKKDVAFRAGRYNVSPETRKLIERQWSDCMNAKTELELKNEV